MRGTLSQTGNSTFHHACPRAGRHAVARGDSGRIARFCLGAISGLLASGLAGCYEPPADIDASVASVQKIEPRALSNEAFVWPDDPSHPVIELTLEGGGVSGPILIELMPELAPSSVVAVAELASDGYYDGTTFHRVIPGFMIQGGDPNSRDRDPTNDGAGHPGRALPDEFSDAPFLRGVVGMGNKGRINSASTQFFIMQSDKQNLDGRYNAIGRVIQGMDLVDRVATVTTDKTGRWGPKDRPIENVVIQSARPVGQVAAIRQAMQLEAINAGQSETVVGGGVPAGLEVVGAKARAGSGTASAPAAPAND